MREQALFDWRSIPIAELIPHSRGMVFLDKLLDYDQANKSLVAQSIIRAENPFFLPGRGISVCIGFEFMAQVMAAYAGLNALSKGEKVKLGMLVGCRHAECGRSWFVEGDVLDVKASLQWESDGMAVFESSILDHNNNQILLAGQINVYQPDELGEFLKRYRL